MLPQTWETSSAKGMKSVQPVYFHIFEGTGNWLIETAVEGVCDGLAVGLDPGSNLSRIAGPILPVSASDPECLYGTMTKQNAGREK